MMNSSYRPFSRCCTFVVHSTATRETTTATATVTQSWQPRIRCRNSSSMSSISSNILLREDLLLSSKSEEYCVVLTLNRQSSHNSLSLELLQQLERELLELDQSYPLCRVVVLQATSHAAFSAGHDLVQLQQYLQLEKPEKEHCVRRLFETCRRVMLLLRSIRPVTVALVQGVATAAGCQLVAACDLALAANTAQFALSGITVGLVCSTPVVQLSRAMSSSNKLALEMLLTGDFITAQQAASHGLINQAVPEAMLQEETIQLCRRIASHSSHAVTRGKDMFYRQLSFSVPEASAYVVDRIVEDLCHSEDAAIGISAFLQKRMPPDWKGR